MTETQDCQELGGHIKFRWRWTEDGYKMIPNAHCPDCGEKL